ncbi:MAG: hypothetical protein JKY56_16420 [Kofleriaceae bacterium]|nr:hypothetical protein [Kofleriaceae bacterium]
MYVRILWVLPVAALVACGPSKHQRLVSSAQKAEKNQQWVQAAIAYGKACSADPAQISICERAQVMRDYAVEIRSYRAQQYCHAGQLQACLQEIAPVRDFRTTVFPRIASVLASAGELAIRQCQPPGASPTLRLRLQGLACIQPWRAGLWDDPHYQQHYRTESRTVATGFLKLAVDERDPGARLSYSMAASCLAPVEIKASEAMSNAAQLFGQQSETQLRMVRANSGVSCQSLVSGLGRGLGCNAGSAHALDVDVLSSGNQSRWQHTYVDRSHTKRYLSGTRQITNPEYDRSKLEYEMAEDRVQSGKDEVREREYRCRETDEAYDCSAHKTSVRELKSLESSLRAASDRYRNEDPTITEDVYSDYEYTIRSHRWAAPFGAQIRAGGSSMVSPAMEVVYVDSEQSSFAPAGILSDPVDPPPLRYFQDHSNAWLKRQVQEQLVVEMGRRSEGVLAQCGDGAAVACWSTAHYWQGHNDFGLALLKYLSESDALRCTAGVL